MSLKNKYGLLEYHHYEVTCLKNSNDDFLKLAPKYWDEKIKKVYTINAIYPNKKYEDLFNLPIVQNTFNALGELLKWDKKRMVFQLIILKNVIYLNPYFKGISDNLFYGRECFIPDILLPFNIDITKTKIQMLGGDLITEPRKHIDLLIMPRAASKKYNKLFFAEIEKYVFRDIISINTLNSVYCKVFTGYNY